LFILSDSFVKCIYFHKFK